MLQHLPDELLRCLLLFVKPTDLFRQIPRINKQFYNLIARNYHSQLETQRFFQEVFSNCFTRVNAKKEIQSNFREIVIYFVKQYKYQHSNVVSRFEYAVVNGHERYIHLNLYYKYRNHQFYKFNLQTMQMDKYNNSVTHSSSSSSSPSATTTTTTTTSSASSLIPKCYLPTTEMNTDIEFQRFTPIGAAARLNTTPLMKLYVLHFGQSVIEQIPKRISRPGRTILHTAAFFGNLDVLKFILSFQFTSSSSPPPQQKQHQTTRTTLGQIADDVVEQRFKQNILHVAASQNHVLMVRYLIEEVGMNPNKQDGDGYTPLHVAAPKGHVETVKVLLELGANKHATTSGGNTTAMTLCARSALSARTFKALQDLLQ